MSREREYADAYSAQRRGKSYAGAYAVMMKQCTRFTLAVVARNAPLLDPVQVATMWGMDLVRFDEWVNSLDEAPLAELVVWLQDRQQESLSLVTLLDKGVVPAGAEWLRQRLAVSMKVLPLGVELQVPESTGVRVTSGADAGRLILGLAPKGPVG